MQNNPEDEMGWYVREVHKKQVQVRTARQAGDIQQETIVHHADNHPVSIRKRKKNSTLCLLTKKFPFKLQNINSVTNEGLVFHSLFAFI